MNQATHNLASLLSISVLRDKPGLISLLNAHGTNLPETASDEAVVDKMVDSLAAVPTFKLEYVQWLKQHADSATAYHNAVGDYSQAGTSSFLSPTTPATSTGSSFNWNSALSLVSTAGTLFGTIKAADTQANAIKAQSAAQIAAAKAESNNKLIDLEIAKAQLAAAQQRPTQNNTVMIVVLGVAGLAVVGAVIYAVTKK